MTRRSYVQDPDTNKLVPKEDYVPPAQRLHMVMPDMEPFVSVVDGKIIQSRSGLNDHNKRNNVVPAGDWKQKDYIAMANKKRDEMQGGTPADKRERIEILKHVMDQHGIH